MADLDDFFAKKDKKKSKSAKKFTPSDLITAGSPAAPAKVLEKKEKSKVETKTPTSTEGVEELVVEAEVAKVVKVVSPAEEEEWADFEEEKEKDYSGLKIQQLQIPDSEEGEDNEEQYDEDGELIARKESSGPWKKLDASQPVIAAKPDEAEVIAELPNVKAGLYVPPGKKSQGSSGSGSVGRIRIGRKGKEAPDISNEEYFPSLSTAIAIEQQAPKTKRQLDEETRGFAEARPSRSHSSQVTSTAAAGGPKLNLGNKYDALSTDNS